jgi:hypothetical protein
MTVVSLADKRKAEPTDQDKVVELLRNALVEAEAGRLTGLVMVFTDPDKHWLNKWVGSFGYIDAIGKLAVTQMEMQQEYLSLQDG